MTALDRRTFLKASGIGLLPAIVPLSTALASEKKIQVADEPANPIIRLFGDGEMFQPGDYLAELQKAHAAIPIIRDAYGNGGAVEALEKKFVEITGKEKAIFMPSGTMANEF